MDFREGDARNLPFADGTFDAVVLMGNSSGYFAAQEDDAAALREVRRVVKAGAPVLLDLTDGAHLRACDYARLDWRLDADGHPCLLEVNPNPGQCFDGHLTAQAALEGDGYAALLRRILEAARRRVATETRAAA